MFYHEVWHPRCYFSAYDFLIRVANLRRPRAVIRARSFAEQCADWEPFFAAAPQVINLTERLRQVLLPRFIWADALAVHFAHLYRSAYVLAYFLSAVAVFIGLVGVFAPHIDQKVFIVICGVCRSRRNHRSYFSGPTLLLARTMARLQGSS